MVYKYICISRYTRDFQGKNFQKKLIFFQSELLELGKLRQN